VRIVDPSDEVKFSLPTASDQDTGVSESFVRFGANADAKSAVMEMFSEVVQRGFERYSAVPDSW